MPISLSPNFLSGSSTIPANDRATLAVYGDIGAATPGRYRAPFVISGIQGNTGNPREILPVYSASLNGEVSGQDILLGE